ncbi:MAG: class IV adenylate cyclase [Nanoarchaeota archaeon]|nr:class IV adenylate cyclase [Nanoarchaeota archaeon]
MELEMKFRCDNSDNIKSRAVANGFLFEKKSHVIDTYYIVNKRTENSRDYLRIREDKGNSVVSLDYHRVLSLLETEEHEVIISNKTFAENILKFLGYSPLCVVEKIRETYSKDGIVLVFDNVTNLGRYIEIELQGDSSSSNASKLENAVEELGLNSEQKIVKKGYPDLLMESSEGR